MRYLPSKGRIFRGSVDSLPQVQQRDQQLEDALRKRRAGGGRVLPAGDVPRPGSKGVPVC